MAWASVALVALSLGAGARVELLDFQAEWCGPCRQMAPAVAQLEREGHVIHRVDIDEQPALARKYRIDGVPTFVLLVDGQEQGRLVGKQAVGRLRELLASAAGDEPLALADAVAPPVVELDESRNIPAAAYAPQQPTPQPPTRQPLPAPGRAPAGAPYALPAVAASAPLSPPGAQSPQEFSEQPAVLAPRLLAATVRLKIEDAQGHSWGTGTLIDQREGEALVLTCGHVFRDSAGKGRITVDLFGPGMPRGLVGQLISYDLQRDLGLVAIRPGRGVITARVAPPQTTLQPQTTVVSIGCDHGGDPTARQTEITSINKYLGPPNLQVRGEPVQGRSGGGLFSIDGHLIGVCNAADPEDGEGLFAAVESIHRALDALNLTNIYQPGAAPPATTLADAQDRVPPIDLPAMPAAMPDAGAAPPRRPSPVVATSAVSPAMLARTEQAALDAIRRHGGDAEVICIVRSTADPQAPADVIVLDRATPQLMQQLAHEKSAQHTAVASTASAASSSPFQPVQGAAAQAAALGQKLRPAAWLPNLGKLVPMGRGHAANAGQETARADVAR